MYPFSLPCWDPNPEGFEIDTTNAQAKLEGTNEPASNYPAIPTLTHYRKVKLANQPLASSAPQLPIGCRHFFIVQISGQETISDPSGTETPAPPLSYVGPVPVLGGTAKAEISWPEARNRRHRILVDIGTRQDIPIPPTTQVDVDLLVPTLEDAGLIPSDFQPGGQNVQGNVHAFARVILSPFSFGRCTATFTQSVFLSDASQPTVLLPIPEGARKVAVFNNDAAGGALPTLNFLTAPILAFASNVADSRNPAASTIGHHDIPQNAVQILVRIGAGEPDQIATLVFTLGL